jgi:hypothetical protein
MPGLLFLILIVIYFLLLIVASSMSRFFSLRLNKEIDLCDFYFALPLVAYCAFFGTAANNVLQEAVFWSLSMLAFFYRKIARKVFVIK